MDYLPQIPPVPFRVSDPTIDPSVSNDDRYRLNAHIFPSDANLLKRLSTNRGILQLVTANLIHSLCETLRANGITTRLDIDAFHDVLSLWSTGPSRLTGTLPTDTDLCRLLSSLPSGCTQRLCDCLQRIAVDSTPRSVARQNDSDRVAAIRESVARTAKSATDSCGVGEARLLAAGRVTRTGRCASDQSQAHGPATRAEDSHRTE